jgi:hypothetical protein
VILDVRPEVARMLPGIDDIYLGIAGRECWVTSGKDGRHSWASLHYSGSALDLRTRDLEIAVIDLLVAALKGFLGADWDVVYHPYESPEKPGHIHVEYQPKRPMLPRNGGQVA